MTRVLGLDVGMRRTGVAFMDTESIGFPLAMPTISHTTTKELLGNLAEIIRAKKITQVVLGLPFLPSGDEGSQSTYVRSVGEALQKENVTVAYIDERYTTRKTSPQVHPKKGRGENAVESDSLAAIAILEAFFSR